MCDVDCSCITRTYSSSFSFSSLILLVGLLTCKNRLPYNLYCVGGDVKHCTIQSSSRKERKFSEICSHCTS